MTDNIYTGEDFEEKVRQQVEFYFSDSNLQTDKFLFKIYEANGGWVELKTLLTFGRMRQYRPEDKVIEALRKSDKLILSANGDTIRRKDPLRDFNELKNIRKKNTVHIEGFDNEVTQEDLEEWFNTKIVKLLPKEQAFASLRRIKSRSKREFFGVADVEFKTTEDAEFFLNNLTVSYPQGAIDENDESIDKKAILKKMSLLTFREMRESSKRFGVNDVTKRRNSFNDNRANKKSRNGNNNYKGKKDNQEKVTEKTETNESEKVEAESKPDSGTEIKPETETKSDTGANAETKAEVKPEANVEAEKKD